MLRTRRALSRSAWCALALFVGLASSALALADTPRVHLALEHPVGSMCPSARVLETDVEALAQRQLFVSREAADVLVRGRIEEGASGVRVQLEARSADGALLGTRELSAPAGECASLRRSLGLVLTMLVDGDVHRETPLGGERGPSWALGAGLGLMSAALPAVTPGLDLQLGLSARERLQLRARASYWLPVSIETERGVGARLQAVSFGLAACPRLSQAARVVHVGLCAGTQLGALVSTPRRLDGPARQARLLAQLTLELKLSMRVGRRSAIEGSVGPLLALHRPRFFYDRGPDRAAVFRPALFGALVRVAVIIDGL
ncbi:MAG: hypothetical protein JWN48_3479 [Myxococcaceae bacterium]|nr:hypothetical protein [Myxococcaceae bacterium]